MSSKHLYLVDGSGYIFRAYHRLPPLTNRHGIPAGAVYGFTTMLWKLINELHHAEGPTHLAVILDASSKTFRNEMYDQYKAHRPPPPEDLVPQFPLIRDAVRAFSVPCIEELGLEADDIIACYSEAALAQGWQVTIVSSDKDLMQLIRPGLDLLDTMNNRRLGREHVLEKFGVEPEALGDVLALMGDSVDNVPGVPGIGPKTASQLIQQFGTLEAVLAGTDHITKPKLKQSLIDHADNARLSRELVRLRCDAPLPEPLDGLQLKGLPPEPLRAFLEDQGFKSLLAKVQGDGPATLPNGGPTMLALTPGAEEKPAPIVEQVPFNHKDYETVVDEAALDRWIAEGFACGRIAVDTETDSVDPVQARLVGVSLATVPGKACYIPLAHIGDGLLSETPRQLSMATAIAKLKPLLEAPEVLKIGQNIKYDMVVLARNTGIQVAPYDDTMLLSYDLDAGLGGHGMDELAKRHFDHACIEFKTVCGTGKTQISFDKVTLDVATEYAAEDADVTLRLWQRLKGRLAAEAATRVYELVDRPLVPVLARMETAGIKVDREELARLSAEFAGEASRLEALVHAEAGTPFTVGSPKQLGDILFDKMGLKGGRKGKTGVYSTDVTELERLATDGVPIARMVLDWRQITKLKSTYTDALQQQINPNTGRVHTCFSMAVAQTGRLSSTDPNLQNIPIRTEHGRRIRDAFVAEPGKLILSADYSQIELRLAAHMADVPALKDAFAKGEDIHALTAQEVFGEVTRDTRARAKTINFSILYGISAWGLAGRLEVSREEAQGMIDRYFARFPGINHYIAATLGQVRDQGFVTTLFGRKTHLPWIRSAKQGERQSAERQAINAPIQGTSADIIKRAMIRMEPALAAAGLGDVRMLLQVHDELVFELAPDQVEPASAVIRAVMASAAEPIVRLSVPLGVEIGTGPSWGAAH
ncbi:MULTISPECIES: DNA polymerase I [unclassified Sphingomonas]|uniref:DNA polymerase I n=1 Tax=unclassified Sphingomonas TaxID=196159 RepID=UPI000701F5EC|nr:MULTISPECIES: DNA polymerase I [unclassified Sphingomonas]KQX19989.1 DNA polymerase I [Sphingomonas sp. Root1294]KQY67238.1 DNA polymerase I [Sphingomonas sp. Root50]KRB90611.1 DNA polymerase I [Sphingomonas sp. Root720]